MRPAVAALLMLGAACASSPRPDAPSAPMPQVAGDRRTVAGIDYIDVRTGTGLAAEPGKCYHIHYTAWLTSGKQFDTSRDTTPGGMLRPPLSFRQGARQVIQGWERGFAGMRVGGERRLFVPAVYAYGAQGAPPAVPPNAALVFDVELMAVTEPLQGGWRTGRQCMEWEDVRPS